MVEVGERLQETATETVCALPADAQAWEIQSLCNINCYALQCQAITPGVYIFTYMLSDHCKQFRRALGRSRNLAEIGSEAGRHGRQ